MESKDSNGVIIADGPSWLNEWVSSRTPADPNDADFAPMTDSLDLRTAPGVADGGRHNRALELIGSHLGRGEPPLAVLNLACEWGKRCTPPMEVDEIIRITSDLSDKDADKLEAGTIANDAPWPELAPAALYGLGGDIVRAVEPHTEADPVSILVQLLVCFGNLIGRTAFFLVGATKHFCNLFAVLVGETAKGRKGTSLDLVRELIRWIDESWLLHRVLGGLSSGEGLIYAIRDPHEKDEPIKAGGKVTGYQKVIADHGVDDKRLMIVESEFASVLRIAKREGNTLSQLMRQAWDSGTLRTLTKNSPLRATNAHISLAGHVTAEELLRSLAEVEAFSGFANRFLWLCVRRSKLLPEGGGVMDLRPLIDRLTKAVVFGRGVGQMTRDESARELWDKLYKQLAHRRLSGMVAAVTDRAEAQVLRLSMLYALLDMKSIIEPKHLEAAMALWQYAEDSARWIFGNSTGDTLADKILAIVRQKPVTTKEIHDLTNRHYTADRIQHALNKLLRLKLILVSKDKHTGGRPAQRWYPVE